MIDIVNGPKSAKALSSYEVRELLEGALDGFPDVNRMAESKKISSALPTHRVDEDFYGWLVHQAMTLRARQYHLLDGDALAEELDEMGRRERDTLVSDLEVTLRHILKLAYEKRPIERRRRERQWKLDLVEHRNRVNDLLERSGSLAKDFEEFKAKAYARARRAAGIAIDPDQKPIGPLECPWSREQILSDEFFPSLAVDFKSVRYADNS